MLLGKLQGVLTILKKSSITRQGLMAGIKNTLSNFKDYVVGSLNDIREQLKSQNYEFTKNKKEYSDQIRNSHRIVDSLQSELKSKIAELDLMRSEKSVIVSKQSQNLESTNVIDKLNLKLLESNNEIQALRSNLETAVKAADKYHSKLQKTQERNKSIKNGLFSQSEVDEMLHNLERNLNKKNEEKINEINENFAERINEEVMKELEKEILQMEEQQEIINQQYEQQKQTDEKRVDLIHSLRNELSILKTEFIAVNQDNSSIRLHLTTKEAEFLKLASEYDDLRQSLKIRSLNGNDLQSQLAASEIKISDCLEKIQELKNMKLTLKKKLKEKKENEKDFKVYKEQIETQYVILENKNKDLSAKIEKIDTEKSKILFKLEEVSSKAEQTLLKLRSKISFLQNQLEKEKGDKSLLEQEHHELLSKYNQVDKGPKTNGDLHSKINLLKSEQRQLKKQLMDSFTGKL